ncbi:MAG: ethanolamine utilization microcompartment protein EutS [Synergistaceae bacterium]
MIQIDEKQRIVQEFVPGKQVTLAHIIASPTTSLYAKLGLVEARGAIGIFTITPGEGAMIAADIASKAADISIGFVDRFSGSLLITGDVASVEASIIDVMDTLCKEMGFTPTTISRT